MTGYIVRASKISEFSLLGRVDPFVLNLLYAEV